jgi:fatty acid desaturase
VTGPSDTTGESTGDGRSEGQAQRRTTPERRRHRRRELGNRHVALIMAVVIGGAGVAAARAYSVTSGAVMWCLATVFFAGSFFIEM